MARLALRPAEPLAVLVIDDDPQYVRSMTRLLGVAGCVASGETDPLVGVSLARTSKPDVALIDFFMPGLTGSEVIAQIRGFDPCLPCIVVSGYAGDGEVDLLADPDVQGLHRKSDDPRRLVALVRGWGAAARVLRTEDRSGDCRHAMSVLTKLLVLPRAERVPRALESLAASLASVGTVEPEAEVSRILSTYQVVFEALRAAAAVEAS